MLNLVAATCHSSKETTTRSEYETQIFMDLESSSDSQLMFILSIMASQDGTPAASESCKDDFSKNARWILMFQHISRQHTSLIQLQCCPCMPQCLRTFLNGTRIGNLFAFPVLPRHDVFAGRRPWPFVRGSRNTNNRHFNLETSLRRHVLP